jgi:DNA-binding HxlR family transcriptional regulator
VSAKASQTSYGQFCPVAMAAEIICSRWTALILRELLCGTTRFNDLRRAAEDVADAAVKASPGA